VAARLHKPSLSTTLFFFITNAQLASPLLFFSFLFFSFLFSPISPALRGKSVATCDLEWKSQSCHAKFEQKPAKPSSHLKRDHHYHHTDNKDVNSSNFMQQSVTMATDIMEMDIDIDLGDLDEDDMEGMEEGESNNIVNSTVSWIQGDLHPSRSTFSY